MVRSVTKPNPTWIASTGRLSIIAFVLTVALYLPCVQNDFVNWDDDRYVLENPYLDTSKTGFQLDDYLFTPLMGYPLPLQVAVYRGLATVIGKNPAAFHLVNVLFHALSAALLVVLLSRLCIGWAALVGALLWAFHPLVVEPVAWVTGLKDAMATAFTLVALTGLMDLLRPAATRGALVRFVAGSALALLSKPTMVSLAPLMLFYILLFRHNDHLKSFHIWAPLVLVTLLSALFAYVGYGSQDVMATTEPVSGALPYVVRILHAVGLQLQHTVWPVGLLPKYLEEPETLAAGHALWVALLLFSLATVVYLYRERRPKPAFFIVWTVLTYAPVSNLVPLHRFTADSYFYLPLVGLAALAAHGIQRLRRRYCCRWLRPYFVVVFGGVLCLLAVLSSLQQRLWRDSEALWRPVLESYPQHPFGAEKYAHALQLASRTQQALRLHESYEAIYKQHKSIPVNYPPLLAQVGQIGRARALFVWALRHNRPLQAAMHVNFIAFLLNHPGQLDPETVPLARQAMPHFARRLLETERRPEALGQAGVFAGSLGLYPTAERLFARAFTLKPESAYLRAGAAACRQQGRHDCEQRWGAPR